MKVAANIDMRDESPIALAPAIVAVPPEAPMAMPTQTFERFDKATRHKLLRPELWRTPWLARAFVFLGMVALTVWGAYEMYLVVSVGSVTPLEWVFLGLFLINFSWIALAFLSGVLGFFSVLRHGTESRFAVPPEPLKTRTAVLMPIYNESPSRCFATMQAIYEAVEATGQGEAFDFFLLSDTTDSSVWIAEERAFLDLKSRLPEARIYYRHREKNTSRKAGNIADFVTRWGGRYEHMLVLDADSVMTGEAIVALASAMENDPDAGIIQTLPQVINRNTLLARQQQFAGRIYGPVIAAGLAAWMGRDGNYWGHNAIIRTKAFADHAGLPHLSGNPPFGGHVLSHDFIEAALIRRAGYAVWMIPTVGGSYEESPPSLIDMAVRDRRWCQGNLQHSRILPAAGFVWPTRQHLATGIMSYLASPLWLLQLLVGLTLALQAHYIRPEYFSSEISIFPVWPRFDAERALMVFGVTMAILIAPKILALLVALFTPKVRKGSGGVFGLFGSAIVEIIISTLMAPIMMLIQSGSVFEILFGRDSGWKPQRRGDGSVPLRDVFRRHRSHVALGLVAGIAAYVISPGLFAWMSPTIVGLLLAVPLSYMSASAPIGLALKRAGLLKIPEETSPPPVAARAVVLTQDMESRGMDEPGDPLRLIHEDAAFREAHRAIIPPPQPRKRGHIEPAHAIAEAKLADAETLDDAVAWLDNKERSQVLHDRALIARLAKLPARTPAKDEPLSAAAE